MATIDEALSIAFDHHAAGRLHEAETIYGRILDAVPDHGPALHAAGLLAGQTGRAAAAVALLTRAVAARPAAAAYRVDRAKTLARAEDWPAATAALVPALALDPAGLAGWDLLATARHHLGDADGAIAALARAATLVKPGDAGEASNRLALLLRQRGRIRGEAGERAAAATDLRRAMALTPDEAETPFLLGNLLLDQDRYGAATAALRRAAALAPQMAAGWLNLGLALGKAGDGREAETALRRAHRLDPAHVAPCDALTLLLVDHAPEEAARWSAAALGLKRRAAAAADQPPPLPTRPRDAAARRRNIVAFSLWGGREVYLQGAVANARQYPALLPGWTCRFYHDDSVPATTLATLAGLGAELVAMPAGSGPVQGLYWRFLAADDPDTARFLCRDCDSRPTLREQAAVAAWVDSGVPFHVMRDDVRHTDLILAGMWGGVAGLLPPLGPAIAAVASADADRWQDQRFLAEWVWPRICRQALIHDSVHPGFGLPFPPAPADPVSPHIGAKVLELRTAPDGAGDDIPWPAGVTRLATAPGQPALAERDCRHGRLRFFAEDSCIGRALALYGEWSEVEMRLAGRLLRPGDVAAEAGSNIGAHTVALSRAVGPTGTVHAFEPQPAVFALLTANLAANGCANVVAHNAAVGDRPGMIAAPSLDYNRPGNFGAVRMGALGGDAVPVMTLDGLGLDRLDYLKADVEGMEALVLQGAAATIRRCRPALYVENDREERSAELTALLLSFGYRLWWHVAPLYDPGNYAASPHNAFSGLVSINVLGLPPDRPCPTPGLVALTAPGQSWRDAAWTAGL